MSYVLVFLFGLAFDTLWVLCLYFVQTRSVSPMRRHLAALTSVLLAGLGAAASAGIARNVSLILPEIAGMTIGIYVGMFVADKVEKKGS